MISYLKIEACTKKFLDFMNTLSKVMGCRTNMHNLAGFLYTSNELSENECRKNNPVFLTASKLPGNTRNNPNQGAKRYAQSKS